MSPILGIFASQGRILPNSYDSIATVTVGAGGQSSITFSSIPSTYKHLQIRGISRYSVSNFWSKIIISGVAMTNGGTSSSNYYYHRLGGDGASPFTDTGGLNRFLTSQGATGANIFSAHIFDFLDYTDTNKNKVTRILEGFDLNGSGAINFQSANFLNTGAITSISITPDSGNFAQYTQLALYGIKG